MRNPDELTADFQQTYHLNAWELGLDGDGEGEDIRRIAALAYQLPRTSRTWIALNPALENGTAEWLLRQIELNQRRWAWAHTKDAKSGSNEPQPITLPGEAELVDAKEQQAEQDALAVAAAFNLDF